MEITWLQNTPSWRTLWESGILLSASLTGSYCGMIGYSIRGCFSRRVAKITGTVANDKVLRHIEGIMDDIGQEILFS